MTRKIAFLLLAVVGACVAREHEEAHSDLPAQYSFAYEVQDHKTEDLKDHHEEREGEITRGEYSLIEPDGTKRIVKYTVDGKSGFNAVVTREGKNIKETYHYGKSGSSFEHKGNLIHEQGHSQHGYAGQSSLSYNRADLKSGGHHSGSSGSENSGYLSSSNKGYSHHAGDSHHTGHSQILVPSQHIQSHSNSGHQGHHGGSSTYFASKHFSSSSQQSHPQQHLLVQHGNNYGNGHNQGQSHVVHYGSSHHQNQGHHIQHEQRNYGQQSHSQGNLLVQHGNHYGNNHNQGQSHVVHYGSSHQQNHGHHIQQQQQNHEQSHHGVRKIVKIINHGAVAPVHVAPVHVAPVHVIPHQIAQQVITNDGGKAYYNLNEQNSHKTSQGTQHYQYNQHQQSNLAHNENFHHPDRHDYRGNFGHRANSQASYEHQRQNSFNAQNTNNAQPGLQQFYYDRQDEIHQMAQAVQNNRQQGYNPQIHLANQINAYNQQQISKLYEVHPMMDDMKRSQGIVLFYGKENRFSNEDKTRHLKKNFGTYVHFHDNHGQSNSNQHYSQSNFKTQNNLMTYLNSNQQNSHMNYANNNQQYNNNRHHNSNQQHFHLTNMHPGTPLYSNQGGDGYATSYQNFSLKGAKVFLATKHIVPKNH